MSRGRVKTITLATMCFVSFIAHLDTTVVNVALPKIQINLGSSMSALQWILNAYTLPTASLILTSGTLGDIYGRKRIFLAGLVIFTIASVVCGFAPSLGILIAGRTLQGIGAAALVPSSLAILADAFPEPKEKTKAIGIWAAVSAIALVTGPVLGGLLVDTLGWRSVFLLNLSLGVIAFGVTSRVVKESQNPSRQSLDVPGLVLSIVLMASLTYALTQGNAGVGQSPLSFWLLAVSGLSLVGFLVIESHSSHPMLPLYLFNNRTFAIVNVVSVLVFFTFASLLFIFNLFLQQVQGYSATATGLGFLPLNAAYVISLLCSGWFAARLGWRFAISMGLILMAVATLSLIKISADTEYQTIMWNLILSGLGGGLTVAPLAAAAMSSVSSTQAGIASAVLNTSNSLGGVLGVALQGTILTQSLASDLRRSLSAWGLPTNLQDRLIAGALHGGANDLPASISGLAFHQAFSDAFVSGLHTALLIASVALLAGAFLVLLFVQPTFNQVTKNSLISIKQKKT
ncbi:MAG: MFS transporter [Nostoc sp.]|uniref:MFS transporter n=1 Tax=Nostoc sp. TaxID=1180 RepID=UPI002FF568B2